MKKLGRHGGGLAFALALVSCARYETVAINELDYPGACPSDSVSLSSAVAETTLAGVDTTGALVGVVINRGTGAPVAGAVVSVLTPGILHLRTDSAGHFRAGHVSPGTIAHLEVGQVGYAHVSARVLVPSPGRAIRLALRPTAHDGPCSGFAVYLVRKRKPWWKLW